MISIMVGMWFGSISPNDFQNIKYPTSVGHFTKDETPYYLKLTSR